MATSYEDALQIIRVIAENRAKECSGSTQTELLLDSLGRVAADDHISPTTTPRHDTSAMDGYAISSQATTNASRENPVVFVVTGTIAAGDAAFELNNESVEGAFPCVEIMTGAQFPRSTSGMPFDACVKIEDTMCLGSPVSGSQARTHIAVTRPLPFNANRRFAGEDVRKGDVVLAKGQVVQSHHVMGLASVGITAVRVCRKARVVVWSTGNELSEVPGDSCLGPQILDSNGPYLIAALREYGADVEYRGILRDNHGSFQTALSSIESTSYDLVITTGAVSKGKFDFMVPALEALKAKIHFHGVAMRPGHPVLFATTRDSNKGIPLFGLPGNPIATAACFRFLVVPFLEYLSGKPSKLPELANLILTDGYQGGASSSSSRVNYFRHGTIKTDCHGKKVVELNHNQSSAIVSKFALSNCWVHIPKGRVGEQVQTLVSCYPHVSPLR